MRPINFFTRYCECEYVAEKINAAYDMSSTAYDEQGRIKNCDYVLFGDDDITVVLKGLRTWYELNMVHGDKGPSGKERKAVFYGGEGLLATAFEVMRAGLTLRGKWKLKRKVKKENESQRLARVAEALGLHPVQMIVLGAGRNTTEVLRSICQTVGNGKCLLVVTQRLAQIMKASIEFQCNQNAEKFAMTPLNIEYYVIHQKVRETVRWYNMQGAGGGRVAFHFWGHLVRRFDEYDGKFLSKPFEPTKELRESSEVLAENFLIKQRKGGLRKVMQYFPIINDIFWHAEEYIADERMAIAESKKELKKEFYFLNTLGN